MKIVIYLAVMIFISIWMIIAFKRAVDNHILKLDQNTELSHAQKIVHCCAYILKNFPIHNFLIVVVWVIGSTVFYFI